MKKSKDTEEKPLLFTANIEVNTINEWKLSGLKLESLFICYCIFRKKICSTLHTNNKQKEVLLNDYLYLGNS